VFGLDFSKEITAHPQMKMRVIDGVQWTQWDAATSRLYVLAKPKSERVNSTVFTVCFMHSSNAHFSGKKTEYIFLDTGFSHIFDLL
jgi:hypothetical protein